MSKQAKAMQKLIRNREGNDAYESDEEENPYASSVSNDLWKSSPFPDRFPDRLRKRRRKRVRQSLASLRSNSNLSK